MPRPWLAALLLITAPALAADPLLDAAALRLKPLSLTGKSSLQVSAPAQNTIYLTDLRLREPKAAKAKLLADLKDIAAKANAGFAQKKLPPRVEVLEDLSTIASASQLAKSEVLATIGTTPQLVAIQADLEKKGFDQVGIEGMGPEKCSTYGATRFEPNGDYSKESDRGDRMAVNLDALDLYLKTFGVEQNAFIAWLIQHGSVHNAGLSHNNQPNAFPSSGFENVPDLSTDGNYYLKHKDKFATHRDKAGDALRGLFTSAGKFTAK